MQKFWLDALMQYGYVMGIDEAGRGPWAGDVFAAAVLCSQEAMIDEVTDSKKMTEKKRQACYRQIKELAISTCVARATVAEIDQFNILQATFLAMQRAYYSTIEHAGICPNKVLLLIDGHLVPPVLSKYPVMAVIKGDQKHFVMSAASVLAKVDRDFYCVEYLNTLYPQYHFDQHKGYGTKLHQSVLAQYGPCPAHRRSFKPILQFLAKNPTHLCHQ